MTINVTWQNLITAGAVLSALVLVITHFAKFVRWVDNQKKQDDKIDALRKHHEEDMHESRAERQLLIYGILACLKGLKEQGCNGPVTEAIGKIEKHLNAQAHR